MKAQKPTASLQQKLRGMINYGHSNHVVWSDLGLLTTSVSTELVEDLLEETKPGIIFFRGTIECLYELRKLVIVVMSGPTSTLNILVY